MASARRVIAKFNRLKTVSNRTWTARQFQKAFSSLYPNLATANRNVVDGNGYITFISAYTDMNKTLVQFGVKIISKNRYKHFKLVTATEDVQKLTIDGIERGRRITKFHERLIGQHKAHRIIGTLNGNDIVNGLPPLTTSEAADRRNRGSLPPFVTRFKAGV